MSGLPSGPVRGPRLSDTRPSPSNARTVRDSEGGRCRCSGSTTKRRRRNSCAFGSMVKIPDPLHGGAYPSVTVYDYRHDEDRVRLQLNDTGVLFTYLPYDTRDLQIQKYLTSIGSNGV